MGTGFYFRARLRHNRVIAERAGANPGQFPLNHQALGKRSPFRMDVLIAQMAFTELPKHNLTCGERGLKRMLITMAVWSARINYPLAREALTGTLAKKISEKNIPTEIQNAIPTRCLRPYDADSPGGWRKKIATRTRGSR